MQDIGEGFIVVTLIGLLESIAIAKAFARRNEYQIDPNQELIAIGISNAISSFFHSYPITGSFSRYASPLTSYDTGPKFICSLANFTHTTWYNQRLSHWYNCI